MSILKISCSAVKSYDQCPKKYYYNYIEHIQKKQWDHFDLGNICHKALEIFHRTYMEEGLSKKKSLNNLMSFAFSQTRKEFDKVENSIWAEAKEILAVYLDWVKKNEMPLVKGVETPFEFNLSDEILLCGFVDRLDVLKDGRFRITDYKTTGPKSIKYLDGFQLAVYGLWLKREYPHIDEFDGAYVLLKDGCKLKEYRFNLVDLEKAEKKLLSYADSIIKESEWKCNPTPLCNWCDFKAICPSKKSW